ncbi:MAG TPA: COX15/CtaA family protein [Chitinophagaceae bacterium]
MPVLIRKKHGKGLVFTFAPIMEADFKPSSRPVAIWLMIGIGMLMVQVLLGGITRLTGSGLSITEWKPIMGALPPMNTRQWNEAFDKYKQIAQYRYLNSSFTLSDFKSIFFWEWFHRLWARLIGVAFLIPFVIFLLQKRFKREMIRPMIILFLLGVLQGLVGWIMVMSGLEDSDRVYVSPYRLAIHFILALGLICYTLWFALALLIPKQKRADDFRLKKFTGWLIAILVVQLIYGAFMAGLKAAAYAPTWPDINGNFFPHGGTPSSGLLQFVANPIMVQFIHRDLAYLILILIITWYVQAKKIKTHALFDSVNSIPLIIVIVQVALGVLTVVNSPNQKAFLFWGISHQFVAMILLLSLIVQFYLLGRTVD